MLSIIKNWFIWFLKVCKIGDVVEMVSFIDNLFDDVMGDNDVLIFMIFGGVVINFVL